MAESRPEPPTAEARENATAYLAQHNVPSLVDSLVAQLIKERPANPRAFLARKLATPAPQPPPESPVPHGHRVVTPPVGFAVRVTGPDGAPAVAGSDESYFVPAADSYQVGHSDSFSLYQAHNTKHVWFLRHGEADHNSRLKDASGDPDALEAVRSDRSLWDAGLTAAGRAQCARLADALEGLHGPVGFRPQLVVVSPLQRTVDTAVGVLGAQCTDRSKGRLTAQTEADARWGEDDSLARSQPKWVATELCRERVAFTYNGRSSISALKQRYPFIDTALVRHDADVLWERHQEPTEGAEAEQVVGERAEAFMKWLMSRSEQRIVVVTNATFMRSLFLRFGFSLSTMEAHRFAQLPHNCEMRRVVICPNQDPRSMKLNPRFREWIDLPDSRFE